MLRSPAFTFPAPPPLPLPRLPVLVAPQLHDCTANASVPAEAEQPRPPRVTAIADCGFVLVFLAELPWAASPSPVESRRITDAIHTRLMRTSRAAPPRA